uniref:Uncharacterized protein n=1 Tax=Plectus sambesii TaxID=2011161 RepID=A0A914WWJ9_9BILA
MNALVFYEVLIYFFVVIFALAGLIMLWNCCLQCCTSEDDLWAAADGDGEKKAVETETVSKWQLNDLSLEEFTLIAIPDVRSCGVQTSGTLERSFVARHPPRRPMFRSTQV